MTDFLIYLLKASIILGVFYLVYEIFLRKHTFFHFNRGYLIIAALFSLSIPLLTISFSFEFYNNNFSDISLNILIPQNSETGIQIHDHYSKLIHPSVISLWLFPGAVYFAGLIIFLLIYLFRILHLHRLTTRYSSEFCYGVTCVQLPNQESPFSFFNKIYINKHQFNSQELQYIIAHEKVHIDQKHTYDIIFFEFLKSLFWFNPIIWLMINVLRETHEYLADLTVLEYSSNASAYQLLILKQSVGHSRFSLVNPFNQSQVIRRIEMLNKERSSRIILIKSIIIIPCLILLNTFFNAPGTAMGSPIVKIDDNNFVYPLLSGRLTVGYEQMINPFTKKQVHHDGWDIAVPEGTDIYSCQKGIVTYADSINGHGIRIIIQHANGYSTSYSHLSKIFVSRKEEVSSGQIIGLVGNTGKSTAPHLHFEIRLKGEIIDPINKLEINRYKRK
jgi:beta-lactamase regulating signal transducer with metallopeptidase domain